MTKGEPVYEGFELVLVAWKDAFVTLTGIIFIDLVLSGDNALVIGATASTMPGKLRTYALLAGGGIAIVLRILCTTIATFLLDIPYLQTAGGLLILFVAVRLLKDQSNEPAVPTSEQPSTGLNDEALPSLGKFLARGARSLFGRRSSTAKNQFFMAIITIVIADITMSVDNIISVAALAKGNILFLVLGLGLSITLLILGSAVVAALMHRFPMLIFLAELILAWISGKLIWNDLSKIPQIDYSSYQITLYILTFAIVIGAALLIWLQQRRKIFVENQERLPDEHQNIGTNNLT